MKTFRTMTHGLLMLSLVVLFFSPVFAETEHAEHSSVAIEHSTDIQHSTDYHHQSSELGKELPLWAAIPFAGILLSIALFPLFAPHFWHHHYSKVALFWALVFTIPFLFAQKGQALYEILHIYILDYIPFIILLFGLFTVAGGILVRGSLKGTPAINTLMLAIGTVLASMMGTTGASMILIRPVLRANKERKNKVHVIVFFIFLVSNIGGSLTPLGDPPLFLGFLHGIPFFWTFKLLPEYLFASGLLLVMFYILDTVISKREGLIFKDEEKIPLGLEGIHNFIFLGGIIAAVLLSGFWKSTVEFNIFHVTMPLQNLTRDLLILLMAYLSLKTTHEDIHQGNDFSWEPIREVAYLFAGIFVTIIPALLILKAGEEGAMSALIKNISHTWHYFWATGILSSFLDNAPTYLTFFNTAMGKLGLSETQVAAYLASGVIPDGKTAELMHNFVTYLKAVSVGAVFMGANTYVGNAPNFMVRSIAEESGISMPSFFGYMVKYSIPVLFTLFIVMTFIFFR